MGSLCFDKQPSSAFGNHADDKESPSGQQTNSQHLPNSQHLDIYWKPQVTLKSLQHFTCSSDHGIGFNMYASKTQYRVPFNSIHSTRVRHKHLFYSSYTKAIIEHNVKKSKDLFLCFFFLCFCLTVLFVMVYFTTLFVSASSLKPYKYNCKSTVLSTKGRSFIPPKNNFLLHNLNNPLHDSHIFFLGYSSYSGDILTAQ